MRTLTRTLLALSALALGLAAGCTCAVDPDQYLGARDGDPGRDGGPDGGPDAGPVVIPDGGDAGPPAENLAPEASGVGLSSYRPTLDTQLEAIVGPYRDPNNDAVTVEFTWYADGAPIAGETGARLLLDAARFAVGTEIRVEVLVGDGELATQISAGPAVITDDDLTRWNLLLPPRARSAGNAVFDGFHQRILYYAFSRGRFFGLWEYQLRQDGAQGRWVQLANVRGTPPDVDGPVLIPDLESGRILFLGGSRGSGSTRVGVWDLWSLDFDTDQGNERWSQITTTGTPPTPRNAALVQLIHLADDSPMLFVYGGIDDTTSMVQNDAFYLDVNGASWQQINATALTAPRALPVPLFDRATGNLYLIGGAIFGMPVVGSQAVFVMDVNNTSAGFSDTGWEIPTELFGGDAFLRDGVATIVGGTTMVDGDLSTPTDIVTTLDLTTGATTETAAPGLGAPIARAYSRRPYDDDVLIYARSFNGQVLAFHDLDLMDATYSGVTGEGIDLPPQMMQGVGADARGASVVFAGGRTNFETPATGNQDVWLWEDERFRRPTAMGTNPGPRWGFVYEGTTAFDFYDLFVIGGRAPSGLTDLSISRLDVRDSPPAWTDHPLDSAATSPTAREGHVMFRGHCRDTRGGFVGVVGGRVSGAFTDETRIADCAFAGGIWDDCEWFDPNPPGSRAPAVAYAAAAQLHGTEISNEYTFLFGGERDSGGPGPSDEVSFFRACAGRDAAGIVPWVPVSVAAPRPSGRFGHSFTGRVVSDRVSEAYVAFGGTDGTGSNNLGDVWRMRWNGNPSAPGAMFMEVTPAGQGPDARMFHIAVYDRTEDRILFYGGLIDGEVQDDLWELRLR